MNTTIQAGLSRVTGDRPLLLTYALIGNDVCNGHEDTVADMTTPAVMRANVLATMAYLDRRLPNGCVCPCGCGFGVCTRCAVPPACW